ncbi:hypothetical protein ASG43_17195 [Aureimonas sp. Leaf454]|uniref:hypothetical protein n=1 Tax=Aureimonas sp. Leaf454 TaxID=1736381 RepID=UPI0006FBDCC9|nr:hypothetical protein [Aureimonas sp. Leaf454]KQT42016.1 hypothetical protein ASG43_17195 [Aureimonas sp. Leaf454]
MVLALIMRLFTGEAGIMFARLKRLAGLYLLMAILALVMLAFLLLALFAWIASHIGVIETALIFAGVTFVLLVVTFVMAKITGRKPANRADDRLQRDIASIAGVTALSNAPQLLRVLRQRKGLVIVPAAAVGFAGLYGILSFLRGR